MQKVVSYDKIEGMKRQEPERVVKKHLQHIEKHCNHIPGSFNPDDLHDLRVEYKKTRAYLRLLQTDAKAGEPEIPDTLKNVYHAGGMIRDVQLFLTVLDKTEHASLLTSYTGQWRQRLFIYKEQMIKAIEKLRYRKMWIALKKELPGELTIDTIRKFLHQKIAAIHILLLTVEHEKDLHAIRKHTKDMVYTLRLPEAHKASFIKAEGLNEKMLDDMATKLGDFNDMCLRVSLLQDGGSIQPTEPEKPVVEQLRNIWTNQKEQQMQQLLREVQQLHMQHEF